jgi:Stage II sporulation protein E (SpoIIE)
MATPTLWRTVPKKSIVIFLLAVFFTFAGIGFTNDIFGMGGQPPLRFSLSILIYGVFTTSYAASGIALRKNFWKPFLPLFAVHFTLMAVLANRFPERPQLHQYDAAETLRLQNRLTFDGFAIVICVTLGYIGFVYSSVSEGRRYLKTQTEKALLETEMAAAREVQRVMVPERLPQVPGYAIENVYLPAAEVGGDFFQLIPLKSGRTLAVIGDVSGKGLRAAMIVSMIIGTLRTLADFTEEPAAILAELNRRLLGSEHGHMHEGFATCVVLRLADQGQLTLANAGHIPPYLNGAEVDFKGSMPLGVTNTATWDPTTLQLAVNDAIVLLTDGIAEARNGQGALLGFPKIETMLRNGATAKTLAETAQQHGQNDDITVISIVRTA